MNMATVKKDETYVHGDSDSDVPDDVSFSSSKEAALGELKKESSVRRVRKRQMKERRRKLNELRTQQKKLKLAKLEALKLPENILENLTSKPKHHLQAQTRSATTTSVNTSDGHHSPDDVLQSDSEDETEDIQSDSDGSADEKDDNDIDHVSGSDEEDDNDLSKHSTAADFVPLALNPPTVDVKPITEKDHALLADSKERALSFLKNRLYGSEVKRESSKEMFAKQQKTQYVSETT